VSAHGPQAVLVPPRPGAGNAAADDGPVEAVLAVRACTLSLERLSYTGTVRGRGFGLTGAAGASVPHGGSSWRVAVGQYRADGTMPCPWSPIREPQRASRRRQGGLLLELT